MKQIIYAPVLTEKAARLSEEGRHYSFRVSKDANKIEIRKAIEERYPDIDVKEVRTMVVRGKRKRQFTKKGPRQGPSGVLEEGRRDVALRRDRPLRSRLTNQGAKPAVAVGTNALNAMAIRKLKPTTPGQRHRSVSQFETITKSEPEKSLLDTRKRTGGRNNHGRKTSRHRGGGHKRRYRIIDFKRNKHGIPARVAAIEYDPNRSARIALLVYADGEKRYIIAPDKLEVGQSVVSGPGSSPDRGNCLPLAEIPLGTTVHAIEMKPGKGAQMARSAGTYAQLTAREGRFANLKLPSGEVRRVPVDCVATIGQTSNPDHMNIEIGKAGRKRWLGVRPQTRGVAMNPVDHPMGGGEGKSSGGHPKSPTGVYAKGFKTRKKKKASNQFIVRRRKAKK